MIRLLVAPTQYLLHRFFPDQIPTAACKFCNILPQLDDPYRNIRHVLFRCATLHPYRIDVAATLRLLLSLPPDLSDEDVIRRFFTWDLMVLHHYAQLPDTIELDDFFTIPPHISSSLADIFESFLRRSGVLREWSKGIRYLVVRARAA